jgi:hypothetical protein
MGFINLFNRLDIMRLYLFLYLSFLITFMGCAEENTNDVKDTQKIENQSGTKNKDQRKTEKRQVPKERESQEEIEKPKKQAEEEKSQEEIEKQKKRAEEEKSQEEIEKQKKRAEEEKKRQEGKRVIIRQLYELQSMYKSNQAEIEKFMNTIRDRGRKVRDKRVLEKNKQDFIKLLEEGRLIVGGDFKTAINEFNEFEKYLGLFINSHRTGYSKDLPTIQKVKTKIESLFKEIEDNYKLILKKIDAAKKLTL